MVLSPRDEGSKSASSSSQFLYRFATLCICILVSLSVASSLDLGNLTQCPLFLVEKLHPFARVGHPVLSTLARVVVSNSNVLFSL